MPTVGRVLETSLYVDDLARSIDFYKRVFGWELLSSDERFGAFSVSGQQVLLVFRKKATTIPVSLPGGIIPAHDGDGQLHLAFTIPANEETAWTTHLREHNIPVESRVAWPRGGASLYFRDPDGHLLELITPGCWAIY